MMNWSLLALTLFSCTVGQVFAKEVRYLARSPKALLMGDAYTAAVDDDFILFYNPAAINKTLGVYLHPINPTLGATNVLDDSDRFKNLPKDAPGLSSRLLGYPVYLQAGAFPGLRFGPIALTLFASSSMSLAIENAVHPFIDVDYRYDRGFIFGFAHSFGSAKKRTYKSFKAKTTAGQRATIGVSLKYINREGIDEKFSLFSPDILQRVNTSGSDIGELKKALGYSKGAGWGGDIGGEYALINGRSELIFAASILDVGSTKFNLEEGTRKIPKQDMYLNSGVTFKQDFTIFDYALSFDLHPLNEPISFGRKLHAGLKVGIPLVSAYAGFSGGYVSYGLGFRFWPVEVVAGFYGVEIGSSYKDQEGKRGVIYLSLLDFAFDIK